MANSKIESKWQSRWEKSKIFSVKNSGKNKFYILEMFPYPSAEGLHMGHALNYTIGDIFARFKRMNGFNVLYPMGYDSLGLPAENAAIKAKIHPKKYTENSIKNFIEQQKSLGLSYDWNRLIITSNPDYYKWDQWIFLRMFEKKLAYKKQSPVNWCPECHTVLANEQVHEGKCWRHENTDVEIKHLNQWYFKITDYAEELNDFKKLQYWPDLIKKLQKNWIGKSFGVEINFEIINPENIIGKEFVFLHAFQDNSKSVFWRWLKKEIEEKNGKVVFNLDLPNTNEPNIDEQIEFVLKNYKFNKNSVIISHSLGSVLAMKLIPKLKDKINKLIMIAPLLKTEFLDGKKRPILEKCCDWKFEFDKIKQKIKKIIVLADEKDHIVPIKHPKEIANELSADFIISTGNKTHFNDSKEPSVLDLIKEKWPVFTTRPDTIYGVTFMVISAQHPRLMELVTKEQKPEVEKFLKKLTSVSQEEIEQLEKEGVFTGSYAINPINNEKIPVYAGNFVLADYGSGMVMAVPAHDQRDFEFAKKYNLKIKQVIKGGDVTKQAYTDEGTLINSGKFNSLSNKEAIRKITDCLKENKKGKPTIQFRLKDWLISRQRYWGTPIPIVYCKTCGIQAVPESQLPVKLPEKIKFGKGNPLETAESWINATCPKCNSKAKRETDTMDTFVNSSWYYLRYTDSKNKKQIFSQKNADYWCPVDFYIGGKEHACMHLIYIRFYTKFLRDLKLLKFDEPAIKLFNQGMLHGEDGNKMSKSSGNVINPLDIIKKYSADSLRFFLVSVSSPDSDMNWSDKGVQSAQKFLNKINLFFSKNKPTKSSGKIESKLNKTISEITRDIESLKYNLAIIKLRQLFEAIQEEKTISKRDAESFLKLLHPFCPHLTEEFWEKLGNKPFLSLQSWPKPDFSKINKKLEQQEEQLENTLTDINNILRIIEAKGTKAESIYLYPVPSETDIYNETILSKKLNKKVIVKAVNDKNKHDPENKSKKAKPGKPGIYVE